MDGAILIGSLFALAALGLATVATLAYVGRRAWRRHDAPGDEARFCPERDAEAPAGCRCRRHALIDRPP